MANYTLKTLLKGSQILLQKINNELKGKNIHVKTALKSTVSALKNTKGSELEALVDYQIDLEEISKDDEWINYPGIEDIEPPSH